eukprot:XP_019930277.1 PREDICTED: peroxisomal acyl-coenzyme A oxidase 3-like [Crassostrea gigas]
MIQGPNALERPSYWKEFVNKPDKKQSGYILGNEPPKLIQEAILHLCYELKDDAVALVDAIAPTDFILNSPIGKSDGQIYKNLYSAMIQGPNALERPSYWKEFVNKPVFGSKSKL